MTDWQLRVGIAHRTNRTDPKIIYDTDYRLCFLYWALSRKISDEFITLQKMQTHQEYLANSSKWWILSRIPKDGKIRNMQYELSHISCQEADRTEELSGTKIHIGCGNWRISKVRFPHPASQIQCFAQWLETPYTKLAPVTVLLSSAPWGRPS